MTQRDPQFHYRIPVELDDWIEREAAENERSKNAQVVFVLRQYMKTKEAPGPAVGSNPDASQQ